MSPRRRGSRSVRASCCARRPNSTARAHGRERIENVIELFNLSEFVDDVAERYSHGMRQRTVFASALVHEPRVLIVDEPTVGLDPRSVRQLKDLLRQQADDGVTVFL